MNIAKYWELSLKQQARIQRVAGVLAFPRDKKNTYRISGAICYFCWETWETSEDILAQDIEECIPADTAAEAIQFILDHYTYYLSMEARNSITRLADDRSRVYLIAERIRR